MGRGRARARPASSHGPAASMQSYNRPTATLCMSGYPLATCCALPERRVLLAPRTPPRRLRARARGGHAAHGGTRGPLRRARGPRDRPSTRARGAAAGPGPDPRPPPGYFRPFPRTLAPSAVRRRPGRTAPAGPPAEKSVIRSCGPDDCDSCRGELRESSLLLRIFLAIYFTDASEDDRAVHS